MTTAKETISKKMDDGYSNGEILDMKIRSRNSTDISLRYIQLVRNEWKYNNYSNTKKAGRTENVLLFSYNDLKFYALNPSKAEEMVKRRFKDYYNSKLTPYTIDKLPHLQLRYDVLKRDDYICQKCGDFINLECHHFQNKKSLNPDDCITLCRDCHILEHK